MPTGRPDINLHAILSNPIGNAIASIQNSWGSYGNGPIAGYPISSPNQLTAENRGSSGKPITDQSRDKRPMK
jgi:hypothetical protein